MKTIDTQILKIKQIERDTAKIERAAAVLRQGGLVAMPTETVYGLAANALDEAAVRAVFAAKGRPADNPLIVHISDRTWIARLALACPTTANALMDAFFPGPLTIILKKSPLVPDAVTCGMDTVAIRMPVHPVARALIDACGFPLAAPSANRSGSPSPTTAQHVLADMDGRIGCILDGGPCTVGVESTVLSLAGDTPRLLRPGFVTPEEIEAVIGPIAIDEAVTERLPEGVAARSPGMKYKHYAPKTRVILIDGPLDRFAGWVEEHHAENPIALCFDGDETYIPAPCVNYGRENCPEQQARQLFAALREVDAYGAGVCYARMPQKTGVALSVYNRMLRAAAFEVIVL